MNKAVALPESSSLEIMAPNKLRAVAAQARSELIKRSAPTDIIRIAATLDAIEDLMHAAGMYKPAEILPINQSRMFARWKLGQALKKITRRQGQHGRKDHDATFFKKILADLNLDKFAAQRAQRIGAMPSNELTQAFKEAEKQVRFLYFNELIKLARPHWYKENREDKHKAIAEAAKKAKQSTVIGPFPLIYLDPPWKFSTYSEKGLDRTPDQHYPTLTDQEIIDFKVDGKTVPQLASKSAAMLMWCTSSNIKRAQAIMEEWGFEYTSQAVWVKFKKGKLQTGLGLIFRNAHEVLLYGKRGGMPGPQYQSPSVFLYERGRHSAKPPEVRKVIEKMYPDFDTATRLELFARDDIKGWTCRGYEALDQAAE